MGLLAAALKVEKISKNKIINVLTRVRSENKEGANRALNILDLKDPVNKTVLSNFIKDNGNYGGELRRVLSKNGVGLKLEDIEIKIKKGQDIKQVKEILDELLMKKKNIVVYDIKRIDIINQEGGHKIILREKDGKACLRYSCRKEQDGYKFDDVQKKDRRGLLKRLQKVKKLIKHVYRHITMKSIKYAELQGELREKVRGISKEVSKEKVKGKDHQT
jgi:hypothetical protein